MYDSNEHFLLFAFFLSILCLFSHPIRSPVWLVPCRLRTSPSWSQRLLPSLKCHGRTKTSGPREETCQVWSGNCNLWVGELLVFFFQIFLTASVYFVCLTEIMWSLETIRCLVWGTWRLWCLCSRRHFLLQPAMRWKPMDWWRMRINDLYYLSLLSFSCICSVRKHQSAARPSLPQT